MNVAETSASGPAQGPEALLRVHGLEVRYGPIAAVRGIDLEVREGEIVALLGANGAGKTSTLAGIVGLLPSRGEIRFAGENVSRMPPEKIVRRGIALTPEGRRLFATLTVAENLALARGRNGATLDRLFDLFPVLRRRFHDYAGSLSGGEQQQLAIARSLMSRPRLLLLDEPTLGLAPILVGVVFELIERLRGEEGVSILLVEQNVHRALDLCDRAYVMRTGRIETHGTPTELRRAGVEAAYLGTI